MKPLFILFILLFHRLECFCQETDANLTITKEHYLKQSKRQKTTAWILLGGGIVTSVIGLNNINLAGSVERVNNTPGTILFFTGIAATITSFPFFSGIEKEQKKSCGPFIYYQNKTY